MFDIQTTFGWFDVVGLVLTLVGLLLAWLQARRARKAAEAAEDAVEATEHKLSLSQLLLVLGAVQQVIGDLENAADNENKPVAQFLLLRFGMLAAEAATLLARQERDVGNLTDDLRKFSEQALDAKALLARSSSPKVARATSEIRSDLGRVGLQIATAVTELRFRTGASSNAQ
ncbi:hypothetical protein [Plantibacter sp. LMC-P-059a]|uniref:hypothetical protein n=1 Tax=Plantibacter sp. LMC-P-059a TaxID=3040297 RepID=UPI00254E8F8F|nr:hypothetical protein [Plantibacter sp. LMC-P-059a]